MSSESAVLSRLATFVFTATEADWDALYAEQMPRVYNFFRYRVGENAVAEDLTSLTFEKAWQARHRYRRDLGAFSTWLFTIARNVAVDHGRKHKRFVPIEHAHDVAGGDSPEDLAAYRSDVERLVALLDQLPARERELVSWKYGAGLTNRAIARITGLSESNVGTILHRTIQELRERW